MERHYVDPQLLLKAFALLGERVGGYDDIELLVVGGMAGKLSGLFPPDRQTIDCDVMVYDPEAAFGQVEHEAFAIGKELGLPFDWLNSSCRAFAIWLPKDWMSRRQLFHRYGLVHIYLIGRLDLIVLKALAGRPRDIDDLDQIRVTKSEIAFVRSHLQALVAQEMVDERKCEKARAVLERLEGK